MQIATRPLVKPAAAALPQPSTQLLIEEQLHAINFRKKHPRFHLGRISRTGHRSRYRRDPGRNAYRYEPAAGFSPATRTRKQPLCHQAQRTGSADPCCRDRSLGRRNAARTGGRSRASRIRYRQSRFEQFHPGRRRSRRPCGGAGYYHDCAAHLLRDPQHRYPLRGLQRTASSAKARSR